jgi:hypothetical protein
MPASIPASPPITPTLVSSTDDLAAEYPERIESVVAPDDSITIGSDSIDETTHVYKGELQILLGNTISQNLSSVAPGTIDTNFAASFALSPYARPPGRASLSTPPWYAGIANDRSKYGFAGASLVSQEAQSVYVDGDNAENNFLTAPATLYGHVNHPEGLQDPRINDNPTNISLSIAGTTVSQKYRYLSPWNYDIREVYAMFIKYGFESWITYSGPVSKVAGGVTEYHLDNEIISVANLLVTGFEERQNIRRVARRPDYRRDYEYIPESEQRESTSIVRQVMKTSIPTSESLAIETADIEEESPPLEGEIISDSPEDAGSPPPTLADGPDSFTTLTEGDRY